MLVGNVRLMKEFGVNVAWKTAEGTALYVAKDGAYVGAILLADKPKATAAQAITELKKLGVKKTVMLTGDAQAAAEQARPRRWAWTRFHAGLMPGDKVEHVEAAACRQGPQGRAAVRGRRHQRRAGSLALADAGVAMGAHGLRRGHRGGGRGADGRRPHRSFPRPFGARGTTLQIVKQNIALSLIVKAIIMVLGATGVTGMWAAVFADVGVCLVAILNASRAMKMK